MSADNPILFFDGVCNLCNKSVDYVIRHDTAATIRFASLQSNFAEQKLLPHNIDPKDLDTVVLILRNKTYKKSRAAAQILLLLGGWKALVGRLILLTPRSIADWIYSWIGRNRYRWFGQSETCRVPSPAERERFLG